MTGSSSREFVITLVHGTIPFAGICGRRVQWTEDGSALRSGLLKALGSGIEFIVFEWSGGNDHKSRLEASHGLANTILDNAEKWKGVTQVLIAHSHGGNVAMYALRRGDIQRQIAGLVTLGTPFIRVRRRELVSSFRFWRGLLVVFVGVPAGVLPALLLSKSLEVVFGDSLSDTLDFAIMMGAAVLGWGVFGGLIAEHLQKHFLVKGRERQDKIIRRLECPSDLRTPIWCASAVRDEAAWYLMLVHGLAGAPWKLWKRKSFKWIWGGLSCGAAAWLFLNLDRRDLIGVRVAASIIGGGVGAAVYMVLVAAGMQCLMAIVPRIVRSHRLGFGPEAFLDGMVVDLVAAGYPVASRFVGGKSYPFEGGSKMRHSQLCGAGEVIADMSTWIRDVPRHPEGV